MRSRRVSFMMYRGAICCAKRQRRSCSSFSIKPHLKRSSLFIPLQDKIEEKSTKSYELMLRAGMIRQASGGIFSFLPYGLRALEKLIKIIDEEMQHIGGQKLQLPLLLSSNLWKKTGRWESSGHELFRLKDRKDHDYCLAPTHEEIITQIFADEPLSHKNLPMLLYQIGTKFRDEMRPKYGLMRGREFLMKDMYTFDVTKGDAIRTYKSVTGAYRRIFQRIGLETVKAEADSGNIGGDHSHEFHAVAEIGQDKLLRCSSCDYVANVEKAISEIPKLKSSSPPATNLQQALTHPDLSAEIFAIAGNSSSMVIVLLPRGRTTNTIKICEALSIPEDDLFPKPTSDASDASDKDVLFVEDSVVSMVSLPQTVKHKTLDCVAAQEGDRCGACHTGELNSLNGIEVGHLFYLGKKYSAALNATVSTPSSPSSVCEMGCYGIGVSRVLAAVIETSHDMAGLKWPTAIAPYLGIVIPLHPSLQDEAAQLWTLLDQAFPGEMLYDDRLGDRSIGYRMNDAQFLGFPYTFVVGKTAAQTGKIEVQIRQTGETILLEKSAIPDFLAHRITDSNDTLSAQTGKIV